MTIVDTFPQKLTGNITVLGNRFFLLYLIQGAERSALFEVGAAPIAASVIAQLEQLGVSPNYLIVSHPHADHITALPALASRFSNAITICGAGAQKFFLTRQSAGIFEKEDKHAASFLQDKGINIAQAKLNKQLYLDNAHVAVNDEVLDLGGGVRIRIMEVKGHSPGNIIAHIESDNALLVSDTLGCPYVDSKTFFPLFFTGFAKYTAAIEKIAAFAPQLIGLGHSFIVKRNAIAATIAIAHDCAISLKRDIVSYGDDVLEATQALLDKYHQGELLLYSPENMRECCEILVRRSKEA